MIPSAQAVGLYPSSVVILVELERIPFLRPSSSSFSLQTLPGGKTAITSRTRSQGERHSKVRFGFLYSDLQHVSCLPPGLSFILSCSWF